MTVWLLLLAGWTCAGPLEAPRAPAVVQLSLALEPQAAEASRFEAIEAISQIPAQAMPPAVAAALRSGDASAFYRAAVDHEYTPPEGDEHQQALLDEGAARAQAEEKFYEAVAGATRRRTRRRAGAKIDYDAFGRALLKYPGLSTSVFEHAAAKRALLKAAGYTVLRGRGKTVVSIDDASDARVGRAFARVLEQYRKSD